MPGRCWGSRSAASATAAAPRTRYRSIRCDLAIGLELRPGARAGRRVALHRCAERDRRRRPQRRRAADGRPREPSPEAGPDERAEASWLTWRVHRAIEQLPEHERPVIELAYWAGSRERGLGVPGRAARDGEAPDAERVGTAGRTCSRRSCIDDRLEDLVGDIADPSEPSGCSGCTSCCSRSRRRRSSRPRQRRSGPTGPAADRAAAAPPLATR